MSVLSDYEARMKIEPLTEDEILYVVEDSEAFLTGGRRSRDPRRIDEIPRVVVFLHELVCTQSERLGLTKIPEGSRCAYCLVAAGGTDEAWMDLPSMTFEQAQAHAQVCEHNPLVQRVRDIEARSAKAATWAKDMFREVSPEHHQELFEHLVESRDERGSDLAKARAEVRRLTAEVEDLRGRALGIDDNLRDAIRALVNSEASAGELRRALGELVR